MLGCRCRFDADDKYLIKLREAWNNGIQQAFDNLPKFSWEAPPASSIAAAATGDDVRERAPGTRLVCLEAGA
jgi:predicted proteasome-type protease